MNDSRWGEVKRARFMPKVRATLRPDAEPLIGQVMDFEFAGTMDDGQYDGQAIWTAPGHRVGWFPDEDLEEIGDE